MANKFQEIADQFRFEFMSKQEKIAKDVDSDIVSRAQKCQEKLAAALDHVESFDEESIVFQVLKNYE
jgi:hypothetical protein